MTLDAGALIAVEMNPKLLAAILETARRHRDAPIIPAVALAQAWRGSRSARIGMLLNHATVEPFTELRARQAGELLARSGTSDVVDAAVVASAATRGDIVVTSDPDDIRLLAGFADRPIRIRPI